MAIDDFCQIINGTLPARTIRVWDDAIAILPRDESLRELPPEDSHYPEGNRHILVLAREHARDMLDSSRLAGLVAARAAQLATEREWTDGHFAFNFGPLAHQTVFHLFGHLILADEQHRPTMPWFGQQLRAGVDYFITDDDAGVRLWRGPADARTPVAFKSTFDEKDPLLWPMIMAVLEPTPLNE
jgi:diadenosine tetraphosphate (Ap4A) HIT family hydrolase